MQGQTINGYTLKHRLGEGGMAEVWYAENEIGKPAAVKILNENLSRKTQIVERFHNEALVMVKLNHPNIRQVYGYGYLGDRHCIIMEYLDGDDLEAMLKAGRRFTDEEVCRWWNQTVDALNYTHAMGIVHRDIKPSNIFLDNMGNIKLLDFGIAKVKESMSMTRTGMMMGTLMYMSPEQVKDPKRVDAKSDIYSLAVTFVHLLSGKPVYDSETSSEFDIQLSIVSQPVDLSCVPSAWQGFLAPYLEKDPDKRPALRHFDAVAEVPPTPTPTVEAKTVVGSMASIVTQPDDAPSSPHSETPSKENLHSGSDPLSPEPEDKPKSKTGLWIGLGLGVVVVAILGFILSKSLINKNKDAVNAYFICEVSEKDAVRFMSHDSQDPVFLEAMELATKNHQEWHDEVDFITLFGGAYEEVDPNAKLAAIFLYEFKDKGINVNSSNSEVLRILKSESDAVVDRSYQIMQTRLQRFCDKQSKFGKTKFEMKKLDNLGRIRVDFPNNTFDDEQLMSIRKMMNTKGSLGFYETYNFSEIYTYFDEANAKLAEKNKAIQELNEETDTNEDADLLEQLAEEGSEETFSDDEAWGKNPLYALLQPSYTQNGPVQSAQVGIAQVKDTATINQMLAETKSIFPRNLKLAWTVKPESITGEDGESFEVLDLIALKMSRDNKCALGGEVIHKATQETNTRKEPEITIEMNPEGKNAWKRLTGNNIGRQIAIVITNVFDDYVYAYPVVNCEIPNGRSTISGGNMTVEEAKDLAIILNAGALPVQTYLIEEGIVP